MIKIFFSEYWLWYVFFIGCGLFVIWVVDFTSRTKRENEKKDIVLKKFIGVER